VNDSSLDSSNRTRSASLATICSLSRLHDPVLYGVIALQIILNIFFLHSRSLWLDEAYSAIVARLSFSEINAILQWDSGPPLYYYVLYIWRLVMGESEFALRLFSLFCSILATVIVYITGIFLQSRRVGLYAAGLYALSPITTAYIHEARNYTMLSCLCAVYAISLVVYVFYNDRQSWRINTLVLVLLVYTHNIGWFIALTGTIGIWIFSKEQSQRIWGTVSLGMAILLYLPWIPTLLIQMQHSELTIGWIRQLWSPWVIGITLTSFIPGGMTFGYLNLPVFPVWLQVGIGLIIGFPVALTLYHSINKKQKIVQLVVVFFALGSLFPYLFSLLWNPVYLPGRTDYLLFPVWCCMVGVGVSHIKSRLARNLTLSVILLACMIANIQILIKNDPVSERHVVSQLNKSIRENDLVVCSGLTRPFLEYYLQPTGVEFSSYPTDMKHHLAHFNESWYLSNIDLTQEAQRVLNQIIDRDETTNQFWIIGDEGQVTQKLLKTIRSNGQFILPKPIHSPKMGMRKLNQRLYIWKVYKKSES
jgi:uncharacterized membrane protein